MATALYAADHSAVHRQPLHPEHRRSEQADRRAAAALDASEQCERYEVSRCSDDPTQYVVRIEWDTERDTPVGFRRSPEFRRFFEAVGPYVHDIDEMRDYQVAFANES
jgi:quinol monooxygenase YgiN